MTESKAKILLVDDSDTDRELYKRYLAEHYDCLEAETGEEAFDLLKSNEPSCILLDFSLPDFDGLEFLTEVRENTSILCPIVMLTGQGSEKIAVSAIKKGAFDYLVKGTLTEEGLKKTVHNAVETGVVDKAKRTGHGGTEQEFTPFFNIPKGTLVSDRYEVVNCLGAGAMGKVYICKDRDLSNYEVAMKVLYSEFARDVTMVKRFRNEVTAAYGVSHPNVVRAFQFIADGSTIAFTMEYVRGGDLVELIYNDGPKMAIDEVIRILFQTCEGVGAINDCGIIHRDLKPGNILISKTGQVKIADFGVALNTLTQDQKLTLKGAVIGTLAYLPPEYLIHNTCDLRTDVYAAGAVGFEMLTRETPHPEGETIVQTALNKVHHPPKEITSLREDIPPELVEIISKAIEPDPQHRYESMHEMAADLKTLYRNRKKS